MPGQPIPRIKQGLVEYTNCLPVYYYFLDRHATTYDLYCDKPTRINQLMARGEFQVATVSAIEYARYQDRYLLMPEICISSHRKTISVNLYTKRPLEQLDSTTIGLTSTSATSQVLLKILLKKIYRFNNDFIEMSPDLDAMLTLTEAALLIGDEAMQALARQDLYRYDLGELWHRLTGLPFVFAVWVVDKHWAQQHPDAATGIRTDFQQALRQLQPYTDQTIRRHRDDYQAVDLNDYFQHISFDLNASCQQGLLTYYRMAHELQLAPGCTQLDFL